MKRVTLVGILLTSIAAQSFAQISEKKNIVKVNVLSPVVRTFSGFYERKISSASSVQLGISYTGAELDEVQIRGWSLAPEFRYYATEKGAMQGFYLAPFMRFGNFELDDKVSKADMKTIGGGLLIGKQWLFYRGITLDAFVGPSYN
jgi:hypothetical protein